MVWSLCLRALRTFFFSGNSTLSFFHFVARLEVLLPGGTVEEAQGGWFAPWARRCSCAAEGVHFGAGERRIGEPVPVAGGALCPWMLVHERFSCHGSETVFSPVALFLSLHVCTCAELL